MAKAGFRVEILVVELKKLKHNEKNPRLIKRNRHDDLKKSLTEFPEMKDIREIVVDENLLILAGDKRAYALEEMGYTDVRVKQVFGLPEKKKREFIAKDNDHNGEWDPDVLSADWDPQELAGWNVDAMKPPTDTKKEKAEKEYKNHDVTCPGCGLHFDLSESARDED